MSYLVHIDLRVHDHTVSGDGTARAEQHQVTGHQEGSIHGEELPVTLDVGDGLEGGLEGSNGVTGLGGLVVGEGGVHELDRQEDAHVGPGLNGGLDDDGHPDHEGHGLVQLLGELLGGRKGGREEGGRVRMIVDIIIFYLFIYFYF